MMIVHSYVKLPEGKWDSPSDFMPQICPVFVRGKSTRQTAEERMIVDLVG